VLHEAIELVICMLPVGWDSEYTQHRAAFSVSQPGQTAPAPTAARSGSSPLASISSAALALLMACALLLA
jgi:hypothetical protein